MKRTRHPRVERGNSESESPRLPGAHPRGVATLEAELLSAEPREHAFALRISPLNLFQTVGIWRSLRPGSGRTLLLEGALDTRRHTARGEEAIAWLRRSTVTRLGREIEPAPCSHPAGDLGLWRLPAMLLVDDPEFEWLADSLPWNCLSAVRIEGEVEASDASAFARCIAAGRFAIEGDIRALASFELRGDGHARFAARSMRPIAAIVAEDLAFYVAAVLRCQPELVSRPALAEIGRLLSQTGRILIRPEETDVFGSSIDIGVCTAREERAADRSIVYDLPSDSWHHD
jgi:hypothetical protein